MHLLGEVQAAECRQRVEDSEGQEPCEKNSQKQPQADWKQPHTDIETTTY